MPKPIAYCTVDGCGERCHGRGYCTKHYYRWKRHGDPTLEPVRYGNDLCAAEECSLPRRKLDLCARHYAAAWRQANAGGRCIFDGCGQRSARLDGLCSSHGRQKSAGRELVPIQHRKIEGESTAFLRNSRGEKRCSACLDWKPETDFHVSRTRPDGLVNSCRPCALGSGIRSRLKAFNITEEQYDEMLERQDGACAICKRTQPGRRLAIDHDHACCPGKSGSCGSCVRGLLCRACNVGIGYLQDDAGRLEAAAAYIRQHSSV